MAVIGTARDGLFGDGEALVQTLVIATLFSADWPQTLMSSCDMANALRRLAGTLGDTGQIGPAIAAAYVDADFAARTEERPDEAVKTLATFWPEGPDGTAVNDIRRMCEYAMAGVMIAASRGPAGAAMTTITGAEDGQPQSCREDRGSGITRLLGLIPKGAFQNRLFRDKILPGALFVEMDLHGVEGGPSQLAQACFLEASCIRSPLLRGAEAIYLISFIGSHPVESKEALREFICRVNVCLAGQLPPNHRLWLVGAALAGFGILDMPYEMEGFLYENLLMQAATPEDDQEPAESGAVKPAASLRQVSFPVPFERLMKYVHLALGQGYALERGGVGYGIGIPDTGENDHGDENDNDVRHQTSGLDTFMDNTALLSTETDGETLSDTKFEAIVGGINSEESATKYELQNEDKTMVKAKLSSEGAEQAIKRLRKFTEKMEEVIKGNRKDVASKIIAYRRFMGIEIATDMMEVAIGHKGESVVPDSRSEAYNTEETLPVPLWEVNQFPMVTVSFWCVSCHRYVTALNILERERSLTYMLPLKSDMMVRIIEACSRKPDTLNTAYRALRRLELYAKASGNINIALRARKLFEVVRERANKSAIRRR
jgi:hypothetical protein